MPVYPDVNLIFVHIPKTAGGALTRALEPWRQAAKPTPLNRVLAHLPFAQPVGSLALGTHDSASWIRTKLGHATYDSMTKFTIVRNPYDRLISEYEFIKQASHHHRQAYVGKLDFLEFLEWRKKKGLAQSPLITDNAGKLLVDKVIRFEQLQPALDQLFEDNNIPVKMPPNQGQNTSSKQPRSSYLDSAAIKLINAHVEQDFELLGYDREAA